MIQYSQFPKDWQVSILGLGPVWMSQNEALKRQAVCANDQSLPNGSQCLWIKALPSRTALLSWLGSRSPAG